MAHELDQGYRTPGEKGREVILEYKCMDLTNGYAPTEEAVDNLTKVVGLLEEEKAMEAQDPKTFKDAIQRIKEELDADFLGLNEYGIKNRFFPTSSRAPTDREAIFADRRGKWLERWVDGVTKDKSRDPSEWTNLIGFVGEYLVHF
jgi:hypothetical protein